MFVAPFVKKAFSFTDLKNLNSSILVVNELALVNGTNDKPLDKAETSCEVSVLLEMLITFNTCGPVWRWAGGWWRLPPRRVRLLLIVWCSGPWAELDLKNAVLSSWWLVDPRWPSHRWTARWRLRRILVYALGVDGVGGAHR